MVDAPRERGTRSAERRLSANTRIGLVLGSRAQTGERPGRMTQTEAPPLPLHNNNTVYDCGWQSTTRYVVPRYSQQRSASAESFRPRSDAAETDPWVP